jgi:hypothetical protein
VTFHHDFDFPLRKRDLNVEHDLRKQARTHAVDIDCQTTFFYDLLPRGATIQHDKRRSLRQWQTSQPESRSGADDGLKEVGRENKNGFSPCTLPWAAVDGRCL